MPGRVEIDTRARALIGLPPSEFVDPTTDPMAAVYDQARVDMLSAADWRWAMRDFNLTTPAGETAPPPWEAIWAFPSNANPPVLRVVRITDGTGRRISNFVTRGNRIYTKTLQTPVAATAVTMPVEADWPEWFVTAFVPLLAAKYASAIREDVRLSQSMFEVHLRAFAKAAAIDAQHDGFRKIGAR